MGENEVLLNERYELNRQLSKGGMGIVFDGFDTLLRAPVAIKQCLFDEEILRRAFEREAQLLANLNYPALPHCIDFFTSGKHQYLVMSYIEGRTAEEILSDYPRGLPIEIVKDIARQLLDVVEYLHSELVLHRDIKTSNIKFKDGCLYLLDLGVAYGQTGEMNTVVSGDLSFACHSPHYSPPEHLENERPSPAGDLYSLAATLYKLVTGKAPEDSQSRRMHSEELTRPFTDSDSHDFINGIMRALSLDRKDRPQSVAEMREIMFPNKPAPPVVEIPPPARRPNRPFLIMTVVAASLLSLLAIVLWKDRPPNLPPVPAPNNQQVVADLNRLHSKIRDGARLATESEDWLERGKDSEAKKNASAAIDADTENTTARRVLGEVARNANLDNGDFEKPSPDVKTHAKTIQQILSKRNETELTLSERSDLCWAHLQLADQGGGLASLEKSIACATDVLRIEPNSVAALMTLSEASYEKHIRDKDFEALKPLIENLNQVLKARPRYAYAYVIQGNIHAALNDFEHARDSYIQAAKYMPRAATYYQVAVATLKIQGRTDADRESAREYLTHALEKNPQFQRALDRLANIYKELGDTEMANTYRIRAKAAD